MSDSLDVFLERQELIQDVVDRLLSNPEYKAKLKQLNAENPPLKDYNRRLEHYRDENKNLQQMLNKLSDENNFTKK